MNRLVSLFCLFCLGVVLAGCGGAGGSSDSGGSMAEPAAAADTAADGAAAAGAVKPADVAKAATAPGATQLVRTAEISVEVKDVGAAARNVRTVAVALGGLVSTENTRFPSAEDTSSADERSEIILRVPEPKMDDALTRIAAIGNEIDRSTTSEDVTASVVDLNSRVATQTRSVARVRNLLDRANSLSDIVLLESELARREADLESIQARQRALADKAALATITVTLNTSGAPDAVEEAGFLTGLDNGWTALKTSTAVVLTVLGAVLPIGVVLALIGGPAYVLRRRMRSRTPALPASPAGPDPQLSPLP